MINYVRHRSFCERTLNYVILEKWSATTIIESFFDYFCYRLQMKSMLTSNQGDFGIEKKCISLYFVTESWPYDTMHCLMCLSPSLINLCQKKFSIARKKVLFLQKYLVICSLWHSYKIALLMNTFESTTCFERRDIHS